MRIIAIDSGTTNSRAYLVDECKIAASASRNVGSRNTAISGSNAELAKGIRELLLELMAANNGPVEAIVASGMITSNMGLCELAHVPAPADRTQLALAMQPKTLAEVSDMPIYFIPGVRTAPAQAPSEEFDMMRGEETETCGVLVQLKLGGSAVLVLPGSHTKFVKVEDGAIISSLTTLSGELIWAIRKESILASSLPREFETEIDEHALLRGAHCARQYGLSRACFSTRVLDILGKTTATARANFLLGAVFQQDVMALRTMVPMDKETHVLVGGKRFFRRILSILLTQSAPDSWKVSELSDNVINHAVPIGAWELWNCHCAQRSAGQFPL